MKKYVVLLSISIMVITTTSYAGEGSGIYSSDTDLILPDDTDKPENKIQINRMEIKIGDRVLTATLVDNSSTRALLTALSEGPITVNMRDYGQMEKVGSLGRQFPRNDESINAEAGDIILFQGSALVIYYDSNSWNFTKLGKIDHVDQNELKEILGDGNVTVVLSLPQD